MFEMGTLFLIHDDYPLKAPLPGHGPIQGWLMTPGLWRGPPTGKEGKARPAGLGFAWQLACLCWAVVWAAGLGLRCGSSFGPRFGPKWAEIQTKKMDLEPNKSSKKMINKIQKKNKT